MSVSNITSNMVSAYSSSSTYSVKSKKTDDESVSEESAVYEKSSEDSEDSTKKTYSKSSVDRSAIIAQMKADTEARTSQLQSIVEKMISKQGNALASSDSIWSFLANGDFTVDEETKKQAQADVAEDGYWGAQQTSDRILDFAKALAGDDTEKADELLEAFKKGYEQATSAWGKDLPSLSKDTYDLVEKKFEAWKNGTEEES